MSLYLEEKYSGNGYRDAYLSSVENLIAVRRAQASANRDTFMRDIGRDRERYRRQFMDMLGWPLSEKFEKSYYSVNKQFVAKDELCSIYRIELEVFEGFRFYGILFLQEGDTPRPLVISQHGGGGTPELCSGLFGDSANYNDMTRRILKKGVHAFAPQMFVWREEYGSVPIDRKCVDKELKQLGGSVTALEIYCVQKCLDYLGTLPCVDMEKIGMVGLSYGGFYTLFTTAVETRIKSALSSCFFNDRLKIDWYDWTWFNSANTFLDSEVAALICPRRFMISVGKQDAMFAVCDAQKEFERLKGYYSGHPDQLCLETFDGVHEFCHNDADIDWMLRGLE